MTPVVLTPAERKTAGVVMERMIPKSIPSAYWTLDLRPGSAPYLFTCLFFQRVKGLDLDAREGVDAEAAWDHLMVVLKSWEPDYRHKAAAWAFLFEQWFYGYELTIDWESIDSVRPRLAR